MPGTQGFGPEIIQIGDFQLSQTVTVTWFIMAVIMIFVLVATKKKENVPTGLQNVVEVLVDAINGLVKQTMGEHRMNFAPYMGTLLIFLAVANLSGLFGFRPPTADVNTTMALAIMTFFAIHVLGTVSKGAGYFKGFLEPFPLLLPLNIIGELATPISLGFRLFGNIVGGTIIMSLLYGALGTFALIPIPAVLHVYFDLFAGLLQSFIFTMLTMVFVSMAID
ncbi:MULTISPECIES: F0F1 ATP synthase subunit A [unclassified Fusibacter]|uniref:F0F1 ATP synthase subunit A n=1 Tax=unclassified Fusibacter TaxID=2624464 RepID=UPI001010281B|nr:MULTISPECIES: F0F1 ATP synthase subunit A [unclassified Fusibacter]MCK8059865.1 F0F1 ATP synthase subunit A [Fusibacter sp. A2]NPE21667.1 F0F1 ATP synthase subunit A [Fusibacter sp. A1]RXV62071.1 ATP synthase F0 subunit A [Fusibacter sp. A1]